MNVRLKRVSYEKEASGSMTYYRMRRTAAGKQYGYDLAFTDFDMRHGRSGVARSILRARRDLRAVILA